MEEICVCVYIYIRYIFICNIHQIPRPSCFGAISWDICWSSLGSFSDSWNLFGIFGRLRSLQCQCDVEKLPVFKMSIG